MSVNSKSTLRVLLVTDCADVYGAERWNAQLLRGLRAKGHTVAIAQPLADNEITRQIAAMGVRQYWTTPSPDDEPMRTFAFDSPTSLDHNEARDFIGDAQPDVIVFSDGEPGSNLPAKEVAHDRGVASVTVSHLGDSVLAKERTFSSVIRQRIGHELCRSSAVVGVSRANIDSLADLFNLDAAGMQVIHNGRPVSAFAAADPAVRAETRQRLGLTDEQVLFLTVARAHPNKKHSIQIDAIRRLQQHPILPRTHFAWVGGGIGMPRLAAVVRLRGLGDNITMCGYSSDPSPYYAAADAFVLSSAREGAPLVIVEAMAAGLPVIATDVGGVGTLLGETGILLPDPTLDPTATVDALHDSIVRVAADEALRTRLGQAAHARAVEHFGEELMIDRYDELIHAVVSR